MFGGVVVMLAFLLLFFFIQNLLKCFYWGRGGYFNVVHLLKITVSNDIKV